MPIAVNEVGIKHETYRLAQTVASGLLEKNKQSSHVLLIKHCFIYHAKMFNSGKYVSHCSRKSVPVASLTLTHGKLQWVVTLEVYLSKSCQVSSNFTARQCEVLGLQWTNVTFWVVTQMSRPWQKMSRHFANEYSACTKIMFHESFNEKSDLPADCACASLKQHVQ